MSECGIIKYKEDDRQKEYEDIRLVKAAIWYGDNVYTGWRHSNILWYMRDLGLPRVRENEYQGFVDQDGMFHHRKRCSVIAFRNKQVKEYKRVLTSEDLWDNSGQPLNQPIKENP
jgi:hypothetical protein